MDEEGGTVVLLIGRLHNLQSENIKWKIYRKKKSRVLNGSHSEQHKEISHHPAQDVSHPFVQVSTLDRLPDHCCLLFSHSLVSNSSAVPWTVAHQAVEFSRQE